MLKLKRFMAGTVVLLSLRGCKGWCLGPAIACVSTLNLRLFTTTATATNPRILALSNTLATGKAS
jgi:hypothetical protein